MMTVVHSKAHINKKTKSPCKPYSGSTNYLINNFKFTMLESKLENLLSNDKTQEIRYQQVYKKF